MEQQVAHMGMTAGDIISYLWIAVVGIIVWMAKRQIARIDRMEEDQRQMQTGLSILLDRDKTGVYKRRQNRTRSSD